MYLGNCANDVLAKDLTRTIKGEWLFVGDKFVHKSGVSHGFQNIPPIRIDVTKNMLHRLVTIKSLVVPLLCDSLDSLTCHYDPSTPCLRVFLKGTYVGYVPLHDTPPIIQPTEENPDS